MPDRLATGIAALDGIAHGGLPIGSSVVVQGPRGFEKLRLALSFLAEGLRAGSGGLVVASSVSAESILAELRNLGIDLDRVIAENRLRIIDRRLWDSRVARPIAEEGSFARPPSELINLGLAIIHGHAALRGTGPKRAVITLVSGGSVTVRYNGPHPGTDDFPRDRFDP